MGAHSRQAYSRLLLMGPVNRTISGTLSRLSVSGRGFAALVSLFERLYWKRLWVVQEVLNAAKIDIYCGASKLPWNVYQASNTAFRQHRNNLNTYFPGDGSYNTQLPLSDVLSWRGPGSFPDRAELTSDWSLLGALRTCRRKLATNPRNKVFGILGVLPAEMRAVLAPDYRLSIKEVYTNVADYLLHITRRFDIIYEAIHFPSHTNATDIPNWVPDWSHTPKISSLGLSYKFDATPKTTTTFSFPDHLRNKLRISASYTLKYYKSPQHYHRDSLQF